MIFGILASRGSTSKPFKVLLFMVICASVLHAASLFDYRLHSELSASFASSFPSPLSSPTSCLPRQPMESSVSPSYLCDPDGLLSLSAYYPVNAAIEYLNNLPIKVCGTSLIERGPDHPEVAVVLLDRMSHIPQSQQPSSSADPDDVDRFYLRSAKILAEAIHDSYGVGHVNPPSCSSPSISTGLLFLISKNDRTMHVSTSSGVDAIITPSRVTSIVNAAKPHFRRNDLQSGIVAALEVTASYLIKGPPGFMERHFVSFVIFSFVTMFGYCIYASNRELSDRRKEYNEAKMKLSKLEKEKAEALAGQYKCTSCPICLEDFQPPPTSPDSPRLGSDKEPLVLLRCGHCFDSTCFKSYLDTGRNATRCPICRADIANGGARAGSSSAEPVRPRPSALTSSTYTYESHYDPELRFRLNNMRRRYPNYISQSNVNRFSSKGTGNFVSDPTFLRASPSYVDQNRRSSSGSSGSSGRASRRSSSGRSFGGGRSSGGGGGGRW